MHTHIYIRIYIGIRSMRWCSWLRHCGWRVRFLRTSLGFLIDLIVPAKLWSWVRLNLSQKWVPGISPAAGVWGTQTYHLHVPIF